VVLVGRRTTRRRNSESPPHHVWSIPRALGTARLKAGASCSSSIENVAFEMYGDVILTRDVPESGRVPAT
jgi:hypothetical protein